MPRTIQPWTQDKLRLLELYLPGYLQATAGAIDRIYIDGFAGPGLNQLAPTGVAVPGSPLIALDAMATVRPDVRFTELYFIEFDPNVANELAEEIARRGGDGRARVIVGDVNEELPRLMESVSQRAPTFVFLDPEGIDPRWDTIRAIAPWRVELLINFPLGMAINRNPGSQKTNDYFGRPGWREHWDRGDYREVREFYKQGLATLGLTRQHDDDRLIRRWGTGGQKYYWMIHASKHDAGQKIWDWVLKQPDARGQSRLEL